MDLRASHIFFFNFCNFSNSNYGTLRYGGGTEIRFTSTSFAWLPGKKTKTKRVFPHVYVYGHARNVRHIKRLDGRYQMWECWLARACHRRGMSASFLTGARQGSSTVSERGVPCQFSPSIRPVCLTWQRSGPGPYGRWSYRRAESDLPLNHEHQRGIILQVTVGERNIPFFGPVVWRKCHFWTVNLHSHLNHYLSSTSF